MAESSKTGPATVIISGGLGYDFNGYSCGNHWFCIVLAYLSAIQFDMANLLSAQNLGLGLYGIGIAAVGMLSTLGITLATDATDRLPTMPAGMLKWWFGPVRKRTDALDALVLTAATGKKLCYWLTAGIISILY